MKKHKLVHDMFDNFMGLVWSPVYVENLITINSQKGCSLDVVFNLHKMLYLIGESTVKQQI